MNNRGRGNSILDIDGMRNEWLPSELTPDAYCII